jgi:bifunctional DNA-binding transcriptional regulator/antitoxin component of YhaV-PrlF toxin-antitoxin module
VEFKTSIDKAGRILLPRRVLRQAQFAPGDELRVESDGDTITLRPVRAKAMLTKELGIWVYQGGFSSQAIGPMIDRERKRRLRELF